MAKKAEGVITDSRERTTDTLFNDLESVALASEGSDLNTTEDHFCVYSQMHSRHHREATGNQIRTSKTTVLCMPSTLCGCYFVLSVSTVRDVNTVDTRQEHTKTVKILSLLDRY